MALLREAIGGEIRRARTERQRTLRDVSRDARVSLGYLSEIERGRKEPSSELLAAICEALAVSLPDLLDDVAESLRPGPARTVPAVPARLAEHRFASAAVDPALRSAVEEAFGGAPAVEAPVAEGPAGVEEPAAGPAADEVVDLLQADAADESGEGLPEDDATTGELRLVELVTVGRPDVVRSAA